MKAVASSSIGQYQSSILALADYYRTVELGLCVCLNSLEPSLAPSLRPTRDGTIGAIVFGSDQGLVGQFNEAIADFAMQKLAAMEGKPAIWTVGERVYSRMADSGLSVLGQFDLPNSVKGISALVSRVQIDCETHREKGEYERLYVFHNRPGSGGQYEPFVQRLLPLDRDWEQRLAKLQWPTTTGREVIGPITATLRALIREYLFVSLFQACAESLASENMSRLAAMQRADKNIDDLLVSLQGAFHRQRQATIDEELFDVISGFEALTVRT
jgi:F-type H+-transporting ATPase subunit gamma